MLQERTAFHSDPWRMWHDWACIKWTDESWTNEAKDEIEHSKHVIPGCIHVFFKVDKDDWDNHSQMVPPLLSEDGEFCCLTTKCIENPSASQVTDESFQTMHPTSEDCPAHPEQDLIMFTHVVEEDACFPHHLAENGENGSAGARAFSNKVPRKQP